VLGRMYNMGIATFAAKIDKPYEEAKEIMAEFDKICPFIKEISDDATRLAQNRGWIRTLGGRVRHFNLWWPTGRMEQKKLKLIHGLPYEKAKEKWPQLILERAYTSKALNAYIQGTAADMLKMAMINIESKLGLIPLLSVHDELNYSVADFNIALLIKQEMEQAMKLVIPVIADMELLERWK